MWPRRALAMAMLVSGLLVPRSSAATAEESWISPHDWDHPWVGRIFDGSGRELGESGLRERVLTSRFLLLGERHDHPDHHVLQARVIGWLTEGGRRPAVVLEMLSRDRRDALLAWRRGSDRTTASLFDAVGWDDLGWGPRSLYEPLFRRIVEDRLPIVAGDLPRDPLPKPTELGPPLPPEVSDRLAADIDRAHCGFLPEDRIPAMVAHQRGRDASLAAALLAQPTPQAVLVAGAGHARRDYGVPHHLRGAGAGPSLAIAFFPVGPDDGGDPGASFDFASAPYDAIWFTPRIDLDDPCERFRRSLEGLRGAAGADRQGYASSREASW